MAAGIMRRRRMLSAGMVALVGWIALPGALMADGTITGNCWMEMVKGRPGAYVDLYEWNIYLSKDGTGTEGQSYRVGLPPNVQSFYTFTSSGGTYSMYLDQPHFFGRPRIVEGIQLPANGSIGRNVEPNLDYVCAFGTKSGSWGSNPWTGYSDTWYQTFVATGTSVNCISFKLAGTNATQIDVAILNQGAGNITTWQPVAPARTVFNIGSLNDNWTRFRSGEVPTIPGQTYALRLKGRMGSPNAEFAVFRRLEDGQGYAQGQAFTGSGQAQNYDLYAMIFSDNDNTRLSYCAREYEQGDLAGWAGRWHQEIKAMGNGLAGAVLYFAGGDTWDKKITFKVRVGGLDGTIVGPAKVGRSAYQAASNGLVAVSWNRGEVPLTAGQKYFIEMTHPTGFNPAKFTKSNNVYPDGDAYQSGGLHPNVDLHMQVVEYVDLLPPTIERAPASIVRSIARDQIPAPDTFTIRNSGGGTLAYTITDNANWLSVTPPDGTSAGETDTLTVYYDISQLSISTHQAVITITAPGATNSPQTINVSLTITMPQFAQADMDRDGDVDQQDFGKFQTCYTGPGVAQNIQSCLAARLDGDEDVDLDDFVKFHGCMTGSNIPANPLCAD